MAGQVFLQIVHKADNAFQSGTCLLCNKDTARVIPKRRTCYIKTRTQVKLVSRLSWLCSPTYTRRRFRLWETKRCDHRKFRQILWTPTSVVCKVKGRGRELGMYNLRTLTKWFLEIPPIITYFLKLNTHLILEREPYCLNRNFIGK